MAALAASAVSIYPTDLNSAEFFPAGKGSRAFGQRKLKLTLTGQGGQSNTIGATALGFATIMSCSNLFDDENNIVYPAVVDPVANVILLMSGDSDPTDVTSNAAYITVTGTPAPASAA